MSTTYRRIALWFLPLLVLLALATIMLFAQISMHAHAAAPKGLKHTITAPATVTPVTSGGVIPDMFWHG